MSLKGDVLQHFTFYNVTNTSFLYLSQSVTNLVVGCRIIVLVVAHLLKNDIVHGAYIQLNVTWIPAFA